MASRPRPLSYPPPSCPFSSEQRYASDFDVELFYLKSKSVGFPPGLEKYIFPAGLGCVGVPIDRESYDASTSDAFHRPLQPPPGIDKKRHLPPVPSGFAPLPPCQEKATLV